METDLTITGAGLAALSLARQLKVVKPHNRIMTRKILLDSVIYLGMTCLLYFHHKWHDLAILGHIENELARHNDLLRSVAEDFKRQPIMHDASLADEYVDVTKTLLLDPSLNQELLIEHPDDDALIAKLRENIGSLEELAVSIHNNVDISRNLQPLHAAEPV